MKIINHWWKKLKRTEKSGKIFHPMFQTERINITSTSKLLKATYSFNVNPIKINSILHRTRKNNSKFIRNQKKKKLNSQNQFDQKRTKKWGIALHDFKTYYKAIVIKTGWHWHKNRHIHQWNRIENLGLEVWLRG
jgi:hypothetical protein